jgi:hypothetical protein
MSTTETNNIDRYRTPLTVDERALLKAFEKWMREPTFTPHLDGLVNGMVTHELRFRLKHLAIKDAP